jgi:uncharacterized membrane protein
MLHAHNFLRWIVVILALIAIYKSYVGKSNNKTFTAGDKKISLFYMIALDVQLLLGLMLYFTGPWGIKNISNQGMGNVMKDATSRYFAIEHLIGMIVAIILGHIAYTFAKKDIDDNTKFKKILTYTSLSLLLLLVFIPWPFREGIGRALFPGM